MLLPRAVLDDDVPAPSGRKATPSDNEPRKDKTQCDAKFALQFYFCSDSS